MKTGRGAEDLRSVQGRVRVSPPSRLSLTTIFFWRHRPTAVAGSPGRRTDYSSRHSESPNEAVPAARVRRAPFRIGRAESARGIGVRAA